MLLHVGKIDIELTNLLAPAVKKIINVEECLYPVVELHTAGALSLQVSLPP